MLFFQQNVFSEFLRAEKVFQLRGKSNYQFAQSAYTCQVRNNPWDEKTNWFFLLSDPCILVFGQKQKSIRNFIRVFFCPAVEDKMCLCPLLVTSKISRCCSETTYLTRSFLVAIDWRQLSHRSKKYYSVSNVKFVANWLHQCKRKNGWENVARVTR